MSNRPSAMRRLVAVTGLLAICLGASSKSCRLISDNIENRDRQSFTTSLTLQDPAGQGTDTFDRSEPIELVLTVRNDLETSATVEFSTTRTFDFVVVRASTAEVVWQWSDDRAFPSVIRTIDFAPGQTQTFRSTWDQTGNDDAPVRAGRYEARGVLVFNGFNSNPLQEHQLGSPLVRFTIN